MKQLICAVFVLAASLTKGADAVKIDLSSLPPEEQATAQAIKITDIDAAPSDTRDMTYIKAHVKLRSAAATKLVTGKMEVEIWLLFKNKDKKWGVINTKAPLDVTDKGPQTTGASFRALNSDILKLTGSRDSKPEDTYAVVRYLGVVIYEQPAKQPSRVPKEWWKGLPAS
jgi:hypothetical protein